MGVIKFFSESSADKRGGNSLPNPRPDNYKIMGHQTIGRYLVIQIKYLDCINYEGMKILVFEDCTIGQLKSQKLIDPHFSEASGFISPIARFEPTERGLGWAKLFIKSIA